MGFAPQLNEILRFLPKARQTLLFTATWESKMDALSKKYLNDAERISVGEVSRAANTVTQSLVSVTTDEKKEVLLQELHQKQGSILVFVRTQARTDRITRYLSKSGLSIDRIHGGRSQSQRSGALAAFRSGKIRVLIATDIAARGIDVAEIAHVINYDLPQVPEDYIHRIGRTGRAGATGSATSFVTGEDRHLWVEIAKLLKKTGSPVPTAKNIVLDAGQFSAPVKQASVNQNHARPQPTPRIIPAAPHAPKAKMIQPHFRREELVERGRV